MKVEKRSIRMEDAVRYTVNRQRTGVQDEENRRINFKETTHFFFLMGKNGDRARHRRGHTKGEKTWVETLKLNRD